MNTPDIIAEAKRRLAEIDAEGEKLRRMIAAAEGVPVSPTPTIPMWPAWPTWPVWPTYPGDIYPSPFIWTTTGSTLDLRDLRIGDPEPSQSGSTTITGSGAGSTLLFTGDLFGES